MVSQNLMDLSGHVHCFFMGLEVVSDAPAAHRCEVVSLWIGRDGQLVVEGVVPLPLIQLVTDRLDSVQLLVPFLSELLQFFAQPFLGASGRFRKREVVEVADSLFVHRVGGLLGLVEKIAVQLDFPSPEVDFPDHPDPLDAVVGEIHTVVGVGYVFFDKPGGRYLVSRSGDDPQRRQSVLSCHQNKIFSTAPIVLSLQTVFSDAADDMRPGCGAVSEDQDRFSGLDDIASSEPVIEPLRKLGNVHAGFGVLDFNTCDVGFLVAAEGDDHVSVGLRPERMVLDQVADLFVSFHEI